MGSGESGGSAKSGEGTLSEIELLRRDIRFLRTDIVGFRRWSERGDGFMRRKKEGKGGCERCKGCECRDGEDERVGED